MTDVDTKKTLEYNRNMAATHANNIAEARKLVDPGCLGEVNALLYQYPERHGQERPVCQSRKTPRTASPSAWWGSKSEA